MPTLEMLGEQGATMPLTFTMPEQLHEYVPDAIIRFRYLNPGLDVAWDGHAVAMTLPPDRAVELEQELMFCVYRQKIYAETLPLRKTLLAGVTGL